MSKRDLANLLIFTGHRLWIFQTHFAAMPQSANEWPPLRATQWIRRLEPDGEAVASVSRIPRGRTISALTSRHNHGGANHRSRSRQSRSNLMKLVSRAGRHSGWPLFRYLRTVSTGRCVSDFRSGRSLLQEFPGSRAFHAACLHSTPPRYRSSIVRTEEYTRTESAPSAVLHNCPAGCARGAAFDSQRE